MGRGGALDADRDDVAHAAIGLVARLVLDRADAARDVVARLLLDAHEQRLAGLHLGHGGNALELALLRLDELRGAGLALGDRRVALGHAALAMRDVGRELVELGGARTEPLLGARDLEAASLELLLGLAAGSEHVLLGGDLRLLAHGVGLAARARELALGLAAQRLDRAAAAAQHDERERGPDDESHKGEYCVEHVRLPGPAGRAPCSPVQSCRRRGTQAGRGGNAFRSLHGGSGQMAPGRRVGGSWYASCRRVHHVGE